MPETLPQDGTKNGGPTNAGILDFRFHDLRHGASTNLRRVGGDTATAMKVVGHKSEKMWKRYDAIEERDLTQAAQKLNKYLKINTLNNT